MNLEFLRYEPSKKFLSVLFTFDLDRVKARLKIAVFLLFFMSSTPYIGKGLKDI